MNDDELVNKMVRGRWLDRLPWDAVKVWVVVILVLLFVGFSIFIIIGKNVPQEDATRVLEEAGYSDVGQPVYQWAGCEDSDFYHGRVPATNPSGTKVTVTVCCGLLFKDCTIRH